MRILPREELRCGRSQEKKVMGASLRRQVVHIRAAPAAQPSGAVGFPGKHCREIAQIQRRVSPARYPLLARKVLRKSWTMAETILPLGDDEASDAALAGCVRRGSAAAFSVLVTRHCEAVYAIARNMVASSRDAAEITQQTFVALHRDVLLPARTTPFATRLYRIAIKTALTRRNPHGLSPPSSLDPSLPRSDPTRPLVPSLRR